MRLLSHCENLVTVRTPVGARFCYGKPRLAVRTQNTCLFLLQILFFEQSSVWVPDRELGATKWIGLPGMFTQVFLAVKCRMAFSTMRTGNTGVRLPEPKLILYCMGWGTFSTYEQVFFPAPGNLLKEFRLFAYAAHKYGIIIPGVPPASSRALPEYSFAERIRLVYSGCDLTSKTFHVQKWGITSFLMSLMASVFDLPRGIPVTI